MSRPTLDRWAMALAEATAQRSTCLRRAVGCVLLDGRGHVLATGYNGVAAGRPHCNEPTGFNFIYSDGIDQTHPLTGQETGREPFYGHACRGACAPSGADLDSCEAVHAEQNALLQCADVRAIVAAYVTASPCMTCMKMLLNTGCGRIVVRELYPHPAARDLWLAAGRALEVLLDPGA